LEIKDICYTLNLNANNSAALFLRQGFYREDDFDNAEELSKVMNIFQSNEKYAQKEEIHNYIQQLGSSLAISELLQFIRTKIYAKIEETSPEIKLKEIYFRNTNIKVGKLYSIEFQREAIKTLEYIIAKYNYHKENLGFNEVYEKIAELDLYEIFSYDYYKQWFLNLSNPYPEKKTFRYIYSKTNTSELTSPHYIFLLEFESFLNTVYDTTILLHYEITPEGIRGIR